MPRIEILDLAPKDAVNHFRAKGYHIGFDWRDTEALQHVSSFTVTKVAQIDILEDIRKAVDAAIAKGWTFERFRKELEPLLRRKGWWGRKMMTDPLTGETRPVQLGSVRRLRIIFDTNIRMAYARGRWQAIERLAHVRPWLRYVAVLDERTRPDHARWHGTILRWDHPFWQTHYPPCGWNCRCTVQQLSERDLERFGFTPSQEPPEDWNQTRPWQSSRHDGLLHRASHRTGHADHASGSLDWSIKMPAQAGQLRGVKFLPSGLQRYQSSCEPGNRIGPRHARTVGLVPDTPAAIRGAGGSLRLAPIAKRCRRRKRGRFF